MQTDFLEIVPSLAALTCAVLAAVALWLDPRAAEHRLFGLGLAALAAEQACYGFSVDAVALERVVLWNRIGGFFSALVPGFWLAFILVFSRERGKPLAGSARWILGSVFTVPLLFSALRVVFPVLQLPSRTPGEGWVVALEWPGFGLQMSLLVAATIVVAALEGILRTSVGGQRWRVKFLALGATCLFGYRIYMSSQMLLFRADLAWLRLIDSLAVILAVALLAVALSRDRRLRVDLYPSLSLIYRSVTVAVVGAYLLFLALLVELIQRYQWFSGFDLNVFLVLFALVFLVLALLSDRLRFVSRRFISRHLRRPQYDYRNLWNSFGGRSASVVEEKELCRVVAEFVAETLQVLLVSVWVFDESSGRLRLGASTFWLPEQVEVRDPEGAGRQALLDLTRTVAGLVDIRMSPLEEARRLKATPLGLEGDQETVCCVPLRSREEYVGALTLGKRVSDIRYGIEESELLAVVAQQAGAGLLNLKLAGRLQRAKQMEAFQTMSAFFVHDLKNLASRLSLTMENLRVYYDDAQFREDALRTVSRSVDQIKTLIGRMSILKEGFELKKSEVDLNDLVKKTLAEMTSELNHVDQDLEPLPKAFLDAEQTQKVLLNLLMNAREAAGPEGRIRVSTRVRKPFLAVSVRDDGPGMSREFVESRLFRPFQTTKPKGIGLGLFHSKMIVEAHRGRIEVDSQPGRGTEFRVLLPPGGAGRDAG